MTTQKQIRAAFWQQNPEFTRVAGKSQNDYNARIRMAFGDFVDSLEREGEISEALARRAGL